MLKLPKVTKTAKRTIIGVALAMGVVLTGVPGSDVQAASISAAQPSSSQGALLLAPGGHALPVIFDHESHSSHASHASHASHYSSRE